MRSGLQHLSYILLIGLGLPISIQSYSGITTNSRKIVNVKATEQRLPTYSREKILSISKSLPFLTLVSSLSTEPASARGRATLEGAYDRYAPRIIAGGEYFSNDLRNIIAKNDWAALKAATSDPPKKTKADRSKLDGGIAERASLAGGFSDARVLIAADLYAAAFSDNSISTKTKNMKEKVEKLRSIVQQLNTVAREGLGEDVGGGGFLGLGTKKPSQAELSKTAKELYVEGGTTWNEYIFCANDGLQIKLNKLPYL